MADSAIPPSGGGRDLGEQAFKELADNAPVLIWRCDVDMMCSYVNKPWLDFTGRRFEDELGMGWADCLHPEDKPGCLDLFRDVYARREAFTATYRMRRHDGVYREVIDNGAPFYRDGAFAGFFGSCIDITEQEDHKRRLERLVREKETLLTEMRHRVMNSLQLIVSALNLHQKKAGPEAKATLSAVTNRVRAIGQLQDLLHAGSDADTVDLGEYLANVARDTVASEAPAWLALETETQSVPCRSATATALGLVIAEVATNSIKHAFASRTEGTLSLSIRRQGDEVEIVMCDDGPGFPAHAANDPPKGIGQALIRSLAERAGATVAFFNDGGAAIRLILPTSAL